MNLTNRKLDLLDAFGDEVNIEKKPLLLSSSCAAEFSASTSACLAARSVRVCASDLAAALMCPSVTVSLIDQMKLSAHATTQCRAIRTRTP